MSTAIFTQNQNDTKIKDDYGELTSVFDEYGNPTLETLQAFYESEHGLTERTTLEELQAWIDEMH